MNALRRVTRSAAAVPLKPERYGTFLFSPSRVNNTKTSSFLFWRTPRIFRSRDGKFIFCIIAAVPESVAGTGTPVNPVQKYFADVGNETAHILTQDMRQWRLLGFSNGTDRRGQCLKEPRLELRSGRRNPKIFGESGDGFLLHHDVTRPVLDTAEVLQRAPCPLGDCHGAARLGLADVHRVADAPVEGAEAFFERNADVEHERKERRDALGPLLNAMDERTGACCREFREA